MSASKVRADYASLSQIANEFGNAASDMQQVLTQLKLQKDNLQGKDWVGKGADNFYKEMDSAVLPAVNRLINALESAQRTTTQISEVMKQAEDDAARCFRLNGAGVASANGGMAGLSSLAGLPGSVHPGRRVKIGVEQVVDEKVPRKTQRMTPVINEKLRGVRNRQIGEAIKKYDIDLSVATHVIYDPDLTEYGTTDPDGTIRIGPRAFQSPGFLAATIYHETQHIRQWKENRWRYSGPPPWDNVQLGAMNEIEAYNRELANADRFGLTEDEQNELKNNRDKAYLELTKENYDRAIKGNYSPE